MRIQFANRLAPRDIVIVRTRGGRLYLSFLGTSARDGDVELGAVVAEGGLADIGEVARLDDYTRPFH